MWIIAPTACGSFNDALSLKKEYDRGEISKEDMPASPENYSREQMRKYHQSLDQFYTVKQELHSKMKGLNSTLRSDVKKFVLMIEGTLAGVQTWSLFLTDRYLGPSENPSRSVLALLQDLNQEEALPLSVLKGYDHEGLSLHLSKKIAALRGFSITSASTNDVLKTYINQESTSKHSHSRQDLMETVDSTFFCGIAVFCICSMDYIYSISITFYWIEIKSFLKTLGNGLGLVLPRELREVLVAFV